MRACDIIKSKRDGEALIKEEIDFFVDGFTHGNIPDYQASALLMAIYHSGMDSKETAQLALAMADSGERLDLSVLPGEKVDKHSTGGVGDKTTLIVAPIVAACGVKIVKMSGRGLGHTGGTIDKLLSIPGIRIDLSNKERIGIAGRYGICISGCTDNIAPADKKLYELRDATATVESIPLIASSVMSKKIASGADNLLLDVKVGSGAFMKNLKDARKLAREMVAIGSSAGMRVTALITAMESPLGAAIGNSLEVIEAVNTLKGIGPEDLTELCIEISAQMLHLAGKGSVDECEQQARNAMFSGLAFERFVWMVNAQGGDSGVLMDTSLFKKARYFRTLTSQVSGYVIGIDAQRCGRAAMLLGAGRAKKEDTIDMAAGLVLEAKPGAFVKSGDIVATLYAEDESLFDNADSVLSNAFKIGTEMPASEKMILDKVSNI